MKTIKGPAIFLAHHAADKKPDVCYKDFAGSGMDEAANRRIPGIS